MVPEENPCSFLVSIRFPKIQQMESVPKLLLSIIEVVIISIKNNGLSKSNPHSRSEEDKLLTDSKFSNNVEEPGRGSRVILKKSPEKHYIYSLSQEDAATTYCFRKRAQRTRGIYLKRSRGLVFLSDSHVNRNGARKHEHATGKESYF
ncbi:hypothetical protein CDAR_472251 [Caerostris darwini]|uniref:Uncharacterized protein n=1 Tax=Caerostris darwini TaxID=1538125 RepID=A0AAV4VMU1_9ARAC|nr:hypothetical protein CDAR_472251 [Caerostris darwini]